MTGQAVSVYRSAMLPSTFEQAARFAEMVSKTAFCPQAFRGKAADCLAAITYGAEIGLSPMQALRGIAIINGQPSAYGDSLLAVCQAHPQWGGKEEGIEGDSDGRTAYCIVHRKGEPDTVARFSVADAKAAQLWKKAGPWTQYPDRMLQMRARGFALRDAFADALRGIITAEEAGDYPSHQGPENAKVVSPTVEAESEPAPGSLDVEQARKLWTDIKLAPDMTTLAELDEGSKELMARIEPEARDKIGRLFAKRLAEFQSPPPLEEPNMFAEELARLDREDAGT